MQSSNIPDSEIAAFADPNHWLNYFPPLAKRDVGLMVRQEAQALDPGLKAPPPRFSSKI